MISLDIKIEKGEVGFRVNWVFEIWQRLTNLKGDKKMSYSWNKKERKNERKKERKKEMGILNLSKNIKEFQLQRFDFYTNWKSINFYI